MVQKQRKSYKGLMFAEGTRHYVSYDLAKSENLLTSDPAKAKLEVSVYVKGFLGTKELSFILDQEKGEISYQSTKMGQISVSVDKESTKLATSQHALNILNALYSAISERDKKDGTKIYMVPVASSVMGNVGYMEVSWGNDLRKLRKVMADLSTPAPLRK